MGELGESGITRWHVFLKPAGSKLVRHFGWALGHNHVTRHLVTSRSGKYSPLICIRRLRPPQYH